MSKGWQQISSKAATSALNASQPTLWPHYCGGDTWTVIKQPYSY